MKKSNTISSISRKAIGYSIALFLLISGSAMAQTIPGKLTIVKDSRIDSLIAMRIRLSKTGSAGSYAPESGNGYRLQIFTGSNRTDAYNAQSKFNELFPDIKTYIIYTEPNFKVRVGDFRTRMEAAKLKDQLNKQFTTLFIISERINLPKDND